MSTFRLGPFAQPPIRDFALHGRSDVVQRCAPKLEFVLHYNLGQKTGATSLEIKISLPYSFSPQDLSQFTGNDSGEIDGCRVTAADPRVETADAWFVIEDLTVNDLSCVVPKDQVHFLSAETAWGRDKFLTSHKRAFLAQFHAVHTFYPTKHRRNRFAPPFLPWMINANHGTVFRPHHRDLKFLNRLESLPKTHPLSMFCSSQTWRPEHQRRLEFAKFAKSYFGEDLVWFGNGINEIDEKWDGLASFERSIVLENTTQSGVFSEKVLDPFLALSLPIYSGSPDIARNFPIKPSHVLDLSDFDASVKAIADLLKRDVSAAEREAILAGKDAVLNRHHFLRRICRIAKNTATRTFRNSRPRFQSLQPSAAFQAAS